MSFSSVSFFVTSIPRNYAMRSTRFIVTSCIIKWQHEISWYCTMQKTCPHLEYRPGRHGDDASQFQHQETCHETSIQLLYLCVNFTNICIRILFSFRLCALIIFPMRKSTVLITRIFFYRFKVIFLKRNNFQETWNISIF